VGGGGGGKRIPGAHGGAECGDGVGERPQQGACGGGVVEGDVVGRVGRQDRREEGRLAEATCLHTPAGPWSIVAAAREGTAHRSRE